MVNSARRAGDFRVLYPKGVKRMDQVPWYLHEAITHALSILSWFEAYLTEELPPQNLWDDGEAVEAHFARIKEKKDQERESWKSGDHAEGDQMDNDLASVFKQ